MFPIYVPNMFQATNHLSLSHQCPGLSLRPFVTADVFRDHPSQATFEETAATARGEEDTFPEMDGS